MLPQLIAVLLIFSNVAYLEAGERIVNGVTVNVEKVPYQVALSLGGAMCGGSIICPTYILTAAHCTYKKAASAITYAVGLSDYRSRNYKPINKLYQHEDYDPETMDNDISLLEVSFITFGTFANSIPIAIKPPSPGASAIVSGYGTMQSGGSISYALRKADVTIYNFTDCNKQYYGELTENMICAGASDKGIVKDSCQGDSGGPLVSNNQLVGIVSFGNGCADIKFPGIYTNVANYYDWIIGFTGKL